MRLFDDFNVRGLPTVFIDGGYEVIFGANHEKSVFNKKISEAKSREVPNLYMNISAKWNDKKNELTTNVVIQNMDDKNYNGRLKVYISEINSRWSDYDGNSYKNAFLDYAINKDIDIKIDNSEEFSSIWNAKDSGYADIYPENLWIIAVVFNSESISSFSNPPDNTNNFNANYADIAIATRVAEGSLPPTIGISTPKLGVRYIFNKERRKTITQKTILIGKTTIKSNVDAESGVEKVDFTIKGGFRQITETITEEPYEWTWDTFALGRYTIEVKVYDEEGRTSTDSIDVVAFIL
jgi:hypothetical protein